MQSLHGFRLLPCSVWGCRCCLPPNGGVFFLLDFFDFTTDEGYVDFRLAGGMILVVCSDRSCLGVDRGVFSLSGYILGEIRQV